MVPVVREDFVYYRLNDVKKLVPCFHSLLGHSLLFWHTFNSYSASRDN